MDRWNDTEIEFLENNYKSMTNQEIAGELDRSYSSVNGKAQRLGLEKSSDHQARTIVEKSLNRIDRADFSDRQRANFIAGFVAGEGTFTDCEQEQRNRKFQFAVTVAEQDRDLIEEFPDYFGVGSLTERQFDDDNWQDSIMYAVGTVGAIHKVIIPFFDEFGLKPSHKQMQYEEWRSNFYNVYSFLDG